MFDPGFLLGFDIAVAPNGRLWLLELQEVVGTSGMRSLYPDDAGRVRDWRFERTPLGLRRQQRPDILCQDKRKTYRAFKNIQPRTYVYGPLTRFPATWAALHGIELVVLKPFDGSGGRGVKVYTAWQIAHERPDMAFGTLVQEYVDSRVTVEGRERWACIRHVLWAAPSDVEHLRPYWKVCPCPVAPPGSPYDRREWVSNIGAGGSVLPVEEGLAARVRAFAGDVTKDVVRIIAGR